MLLTFLCPYIEGKIGYSLSNNVNSPLVLGQTSGTLNIGCIHHHLPCCLFIAGLGSKYLGLESKPELSDLMNEVASKVYVKWKQISIQLGLTLNDQKCFIDATSGDPNQCFTFVFDVWKSRATRPYTWSTVIEVLEAPAVDEMRLAHELRTKLQSGSGKYYLL